MAMSSGCAWVNASNATRVAEAVAKGPSAITYTRMPLDPVSEDPELAGRDIWIPSIPLKDVDVELFYPDGTTRLKATAHASPFVAAVMAGTLGLDNAKFAQDQWMVTTLLAALAELKRDLLPIATRAAESALARYEMKTALPADTAPSLAAQIIGDPAKLEALAAAITRSLQALKTTEPAGPAGGGQ